MSKNRPITSCPSCHTPIRSLFLLPMDFSEIDQARIAAANMAPSSKRGKKRKNATIARLNPSNSLGANGTEDQNDGSDLRTGRWTAEETEYCDKLIAAYEKGELPISEGVKLNDFLSTMLKSKQSRLTKKMKNAKLSAKTYKPEVGYVVDDEDAKFFSKLEVAFFESIQCDMERAEIRFHMQKEWREFFSSYCVSMGQQLDADAWLRSAEELDRRASQAKDAARMARRKVMMGYALTQDAKNPERGVFIEKSIMAEGHRSDEALTSGHSAMNALSSLANKSLSQRSKQQSNGARSIKDFSSPFVGRVIQYIERHQLPFEHIDSWVPSFVTQDNEPNLVGNEDPNGSSEQKCRLCFAGYASTDVEIPTSGGRPVPLSSNVKFDLYSFGEYSSKFSFDVGCGLPGRVYSSGICSWEQGVENAPSHQFERCGGAAQWGVKTVLGVPIPSPNVGRIVMLLYSRNDRARDPEMVRRVTEELTRVRLLLNSLHIIHSNCFNSVLAGLIVININGLTVLRFLSIVRFFYQLMPTPKWKLVVDVGIAPPKAEDNTVDKRIPDMLKLLAENIPTHRNSPFSAYLPGFTALRLLLLKRNKTREDNDMANTMLDSYSSYLSSGRNSTETAWMVARDYMLLTQTSHQHSSVLPPTIQTMHQPQQILHNHNHAQQQHQAVQQSQHQPVLQQQMSQIHHVQNIQQQQQQQHSLVPAPQQMQQVHNQIGRTHSATVLQQHQNQISLAPVSTLPPAGTPGAHGSSNSLGPSPASHGQGALHYTTLPSQNGQNGIAALSHYAQQHQMVHPNGISSVQNDKNGVPRS